MKQKNVRVSSEDFVREFQSSKSLGDAAKRLGLNKGAVSRRACYMRKRGVPLKKFGVGAGPRFDVKALTKLAKETGK